MSKRLPWLLAAMLLLANCERPPAAHDEVGALERHDFERIVAVRTHAGYSALAWDDSLAAVARGHASDLLAHIDAKTGAGLNWSTVHLGSDGSLPDARATKAGITFAELGENVSFAFDDHGITTTHVDHWMDSMLLEQPPNDLHLQTILKPTYERVGIGCAMTPDGRSALCVEDFRRIVPQGFHLATTAVSNAKSASAHP